MIKKIAFIIMAFTSISFSQDMQYQPLLFNGFQDYDANYLGGLSSTTIIAISTGTARNYYYFDNAHTTYLYYDNIQTVFLFINGIEIARWAGTILVNYLAINGERLTINGQYLVK